MRRCGLSYSNTSPSENILQKRKRCSPCPHTKDRKVAKCCSRCFWPVCPEHSITTITCNECYEWTENLKLHTLQLPFKNVFPFYLLFCSFVSFKFLRVKYRKHFRHATTKQLSNNKERKIKICKEIVFRVKITCKSNRGQNNPCYALT